MNKGRIVLFLFFFAMTYMAMKGLISVQTFLVGVTLLAFVVGFISGLSRR